MKQIATIFLLILAVLQNCFSDSENQNMLRSIPLLNRFESTDYNGGIQSWSFDQDSSGLLYIANNEGLLEFDGNSWVRYIVPYCTKVRAVKVDSQNRIFVGGQGQIGYFIMTENGLEFTSLLTKLKPEFRNIAETWKIIEHNNGIYILTESNLLVYRDDNLVALKLPGYLRLAFEVDNRVFVQFYNMGLYELVNDDLFLVSGTEKIPDLVAILPSANGLYYFCRTGEIFENHTTTGIEKVNLPINVGTVNDVVRLQSGDYVVGTQNNGLYFFSSDLLFKQHLSKNEGISDRTVRALYEDDFHNLWVALNNGIDYLELSLPLTLINDQVGLEGTGYTACKFKDETYLGTSNGLFIQKSFGKDFPYRYYELISESEGQVYNFSRIGDELLLNHNRGAFVIDNTDLKRFHDIGSWKFVETSKPGLIIGGDYHGMSFFEKVNKQWSKVGGIPNLNESSRVIEFENDSVLWMTHGTKGVFRIILDDDMNVISDIELLGKNDGFPSNIKISVYSLNNNIVFTSEEGIFNFNVDTRKFSPNPFFNKWLGTGHVSAIVSNGSNTIYYIQNQKIGMLRQENFGTYVNETGLFKHVNKMINDDLPNISLIDDRNILIGAKEGFIKYDTEQQFYINDDFHVLLRRIEIQTSSDSILTYNPYFIEGKKIDKNQAINFSYAAPFFDGYKEIKYSYRLLPLEKRWSKWSSIGEKEYPYLPPGDYTFEVKALNVYGIESPISTFIFNVIKPWYASNAAFISYLILLLVTIVIIMLAQKKKYVAENSMISKSKDEALKIKSDEISQISKDSKLEIDRLMNEKLRTEINLKNDQLTTITMHYMNNNEFILDVRKKIEANLEQGGSNQELKRIIKNIDDNLSNNDSWEQFAYHFDQVHGDYLKKLSKNNVRLSPREIKLAAFLRMNMSSKEISNLMNITVRGVELARHRLRKKLKLDRDQNLVEYLIDLNEAES